MSTCFDGAANEVQPQRHRQGATNEALRPQLIVAVRLGARE